MATVTDERVKTVLARFVYYAGEDDPARAMDAFEDYMLRMGYIRRVGGGKLAVTESGKRLSGL